MTENIEELCINKGLRMTEQRRVIARVLSESEDHPDADEIFARAKEIDPQISIATIYRTIRHLEAVGILTRHEFGDGRARFERTTETHHDHLIDVSTGDVIEFHDAELERIQAEIVEKHGYKLVGHKLELHVVPIKGRKQNTKF